MAEREEWSPWIDHDGKPRPSLQGAWLRAQTANGREEEGRMDAAIYRPGRLSLFIWKTIAPWFWSHRIVRYRIRRSGSFDLLQNIARDAFSPVSTEPALVSQRISGGATNSTHGRICAGATGPYSQTGGPSSPAGSAAVPFSSSLRGGGGPNNLTGSHASREAGTCGRRGRRRPPFSSSETRMQFGPRAESAKAEIALERTRQVETEGWHASHDDTHVNGELLLASMSYLQHGTINAAPNRGDGAPASWPWDRAWWKPKDRHRNLVRAGALCLAEKERLHRAGIADSGTDRIYGEVIDALARLTPAG